jgi:threonine dehydrogenase-like Zn-dependent dehydrogenase
MRQLAFIEAGKVAWQEVPDPTLTGDASALVRPLAVARCDLDLPMAQGGLFPGPFALGHEIVAEVTTTGADVHRVSAGDLVLVPFKVSCGGCPACADHRYGGCHNHRAPAGGAFGFGAAGGGHGGGLADLLEVPAADHMLVRAPAGVPPATLCTLPDNVVDAYRTVAPQLAAHPGADVLVVGGVAPSIGLYAVATALALGSNSVRYVDSDAERLAAAARLGAEAIEHRGPWPKRFERALITVDASGDQDGLACVLRSTDDYGYCTGVAIHFAESTPVPLLQMYTKGVTFHVSRADSRRFLPSVLELVVAGRLNLAEVPTRTVGWEQAAEAWLEPAIKLVVSRA